MPLPDQSTSDFVVWVLISLSLSGSLYATHNMWRNHFVARYRMDLLERMLLAAKLDELYGRPWVWRFDAYRAVSYEQMLYKFWRRLDSFYPDQGFAEKTHD